MKAASFLCYGQRNTPHHPRRYTSGRGSGHAAPGQPDSVTHHPRRSYSGRTATPPRTAGRQATDTPPPPLYKRTGTRTRRPRTRRTASDRHTAPTATQAEGETDTPPRTAGQRHTPRPRRYTSGRGSGHAAPDSRTAFAHRPRRYTSGSRRHDTPLPMLCRQPRHTTSHRYTDRKGGKHHEKGSIFALLRLRGDLQIPRGGTDLLQAQAVSGAMPLQVVQSRPAAGDLPCTTQHSAQKHKAPRRRKEVKP